MNDPPGEQPNVHPSHGVISDAEESILQNEGEQKQEDDVSETVAAAAHELPDNAPLHAPLHPSVLALHQPPSPMHQPPFDSHSAVAMAHYYEARMRDHALAYASAAAGAAWAAAQIAQVAADYAAGNGPPPPSLGMPHWSMYGAAPPHMPPPPMPPPHPSGYFPPDGGGCYPADGFNSMGEAEVVTEKQQEGVDSDSDHRDGRHRRKRQQRLPPDDAASVPSRVMAPASSRGKVRRRLRSDGDSSSSGSSFMHNRHRHHYKKKARSDESLLGKTAVSALYEWCSKRQRMPSFALHNPSPNQFDFVVCLEDGVEYGRGDGSTKVAAKQLAARRALQALVPGVVFDEETGILVQLPQLTDDAGRDRAASEAEDLAPNLEKRLAIGRDEDDPENDQIDSNKKRFKSSQQHKRSLDVYPGTSTTSEDEDENTYYASRGASVCSALLHAMLQIDSRIPESPVYTYAMNPELPATQILQRQKRKAQNRIAAVRLHRGSFACTARLKIVSSEEQNGVDPAVERDEEPESGSERAADAAENDTEEADSGHTEKAANSGCGSTENSDRPVINEEILEATGVGGTKREARHVASAKLLALLFPECENMVEVKAAAEAARERYAASKARRLEHDSGSLRRRSRQPYDSSRGTGSRETFSFAYASTADPPLPLHLQNEVRNVLEEAQCPNQVSNEVQLTDFGGNDDVPSPQKSDFRQVSRQKQVEAMVESALQRLNDRDEEGRSLPEALTDDDVGRTVLRKAEPEDLPRIKKLISQDTTTQSNKAQHSMGPISALADKGDDADLASRMWSSSSIVLLLCRAITAYEEPPLGCAVLTLGFSMKQGRLLRLAEIANEPHLPRERFIECLHDFAGCMNWALEVAMSKAGETRLTESDLRTILRSHVKVPQEIRAQSSTDAAVLEDIPESIKRVSSPLQSVREESEGSDSSSVEKRAAGKRTNKPSKRSRVK